MLIGAYVALWPRVTLSSLPNRCSLEIRNTDVKEGGREEGERKEKREGGRFDLLSKNLGSNIVLGSAVGII